MKKGFTLIELLVVIGIIVILLSVVLTGVRSGNGKKDVVYTEEYCNTEKFECRYDCANDSWNETTDEVESCLLKCDIKIESCMSKINDYTTTNGY